MQPLGFLSVVALAVWGVLAARPLAGQPAATPPTPAAADTPAAAPSLLDESAAKLRGRSFRASLTQSLRVGDRRLKATGTFLQGPDKRMRLEVEFEAGGTTAQLLQVCDSDVLFTEQRVNGQVRVSRRVVKDIRDAAERSGLPLGRVEAELGVGGVTGLLAGLQTHMDFSPPREEVVDGETLRVVEGRWNAAYLTQIQANPLLAKTLPQHLPAAVEVYFDSSDFPRRIRYLQRRDKDEPLRPMVTLDFNDVTWLDAATLDMNLFEYEAPSGVFQKDDTGRFIQLLQKPRTGG